KKSVVMSPNSMRRYSSPEKRYVTLGLPSFAGTASITDSAVVINLHLSSGKPIYVLNHQPTLGRFLHADDGQLMPDLLGMRTKVVGSLVAHLVFGLVLGAVASHPIPMRAWLRTRGAAFRTRPSSRL